LTNVSLRWLSGAAAELSAPVSWALQNGSIWRVMIGMGGYGIRTEHTVYSLIQCLMSSG
jgi:hypothetical protein